MPQYDPDPSILRERCYATAQVLAATLYGVGDIESYNDWSDRDIGVAYEEIRTHLLEEFPDIEGPDIADEMEMALRDLGFPVNRVP